MEQEFSYLDGPAPTDVEESGSSTFDLWRQYSDVMSYKFRQGMDSTASTYHAVSVMANPALDDDSRRRALSEFRITSDPIKDAIHESSPWYMHGINDAVSMVPALGAQLATGGAQGSVAAATGVPLGLGLARVPVVGPALGLTAETSLFLGGSAAGSLEAATTMMTGEYYRHALVDLKASHQTATTLAMAYGLLGGGLEAVGTHALAGIAGKYATAGQKAVLEATIADPRWQKITSNAFARFGIDTVKSGLGESLTEGGQESVKAVADLVQAYKDYHKVAGVEEVLGVGQAGVQGFTNALLGSLVLAGGMGATGNVAGRAVGTAQKFTPEQFQEASAALEGKSVKEIVTMVKDGLEENLASEKGEGVQFVKQEDGSFIVQAVKTAETPTASAETVGSTQTVTLYRGTVEGRSNPESKRTFWAPDKATAELYSKGATGAEVGQILQKDITFNNLFSAQNWQDAKAKLGMPSSASMSELLDHITDLGYDGATWTGAHGKEYIKIPQKTPSSDTLDMLFPAGVQETPTVVEGRDFTADTSLTPLSNVEVQARNNQIRSDLNLLRVTQRQLERQYAQAEKQGRSTTKILDKLDAILLQQENLEFESELLDSGLLTREEVGTKSGKQRISTIGKLVDKISSTRKSLTEAFSKRLAKATDKASQAGEAKGAREAKAATRKIQSQFKQMVKLAVKDPAARLRLNRLVDSLAGKDTRTQGQQDKFQSKVAEFKAALQDEAAKEFNVLQKQEAAKIKGAIDKLLAKGDIKMMSGKPVSKYGFPADVMRDLQSVRKYIDDPAAAAGDIQEFVEKYLPQMLETSPDEMTPEVLDEYLDAAQRSRLAKLVQGFSDMTPAQLEVVKDTIADIVGQGRVEAARRVQEMRDKKASWIETANNSSGASDYTPRQGSATPGQKSRMFWSEMEASIMTADTLLDLLSVGDDKHRLRELLSTFEVDSEYNQAVEAWKLAGLQKLQKALADAGHKTDIMAKANEDSDAEYSVSYFDQNGTKQSQRWTKAEIIDIYMKMQDPELAATMRDTTKGNNWTFRGEAKDGWSTQEVVEAMMTPEDKAVADGLFDFYKEYYKPFNVVFRDRYGVDLPQRDFYSPLAREGYKLKPDDASSGRILFASVVPGAGKSRVVSLQRIQPRNVYDVLARHISDVEKFKTRGELEQKWQTVVTDGKFSDYIRQEYGEHTYKVVKDFAARIIANRETSDESAHPLWDMLRADKSSFGLGLKTAHQMLVQLSAGTAIWKDLSTKEIMSGVGSLLTNLPQTESIMRESKVLAHRFRSGASFDLQKAINKQGIGFNVLKHIAGHKGTELTPQEYDALTSVMFAGIRYGDAGVARIFGGVNYWANRNKGMNHADALAEMERSVETTQQSSSPSQIPHIYATNQILYTVFGQFSLQPNQLLNHSLVALHQGMNKPTAKSLTGAMSKILKLWILPGLMYGAVQNLPKLVAPPEDEDKLRLDALLDIGYKGLVGPLNSLPILGTVFDALWFKAQGKQFSGSGNPALEAFNNVTNAAKAWEKVYEEDEDAEAIDYQVKEAKAWLKTGRAAGQLLGLPAYGFNAPIMADEALSRGDYLGAAFAIGGSSPSQIQARLDAIDAVTKGTDIEDDETLDWRQQYGQGLADTVTSGQETADKITDGMDEFIQGMMESAP